MQNEHTQVPNTTNLTEITPASDTRNKHPYHAPELTNFGSLIELVQRVTASGILDGGSTPTHRS